MGSFKLGKMTLGGLFKKPETLMYPVETKTPPAGLKGHVVNDVDRCILCGICQKRCPCAAIVVDKPARTWTSDRCRCGQCGSCVRECPKDCLTMEPTYTPPATSKHVDSFEVLETKKTAEGESRRNCEDPGALTVPGSSFVSGPGDTVPHALFCQPGAGIWIPFA